MAKYYRAADLLQPAVIDAVMQKLTDINPDWSGGLIYFPSVSATTGYWTKKEISLKKAQAIVFTEDGYNDNEVASMLSVSRQTVGIWKKKYGTEVREALAQIREGKDNG
jgi:hypothetical protein